jgi:MoaA/NifB/PqqE/SkfB family radical SAM enzyme
VQDKINYYFNMFDYYKNGFSKHAVLQPMHICIEPSNACNMDCPFCDTSALERTRKSIDIESFRNVVDEIIENGWNNTTRVTLTGQGEPFNQ